MKRLVRAVSSGSTLFVQVSVLVCRAERAQKIKNTMTKQSNGLNGEHKKTTNSIMIEPTTDIGSLSPSF